MEIAGSRVELAEFRMELGPKFARPDHVVAHGHLEIS